MLFLTKICNSYFYRITHDNYRIIEEVYGASMSQRISMWESLIPQQHLTCENLWASCTEKTRKRKSDSTMTVSWIVKERHLLPLYSPRQEVWHRNVIASTKELQSWLQIRGVNPMQTWWSTFELGCVSLCYAAHWLRFEEPEEDLHHQTKRRWMKSRSTWFPPRPLSKLCAYYYFLLWFYPFLTFFMKYRLNKGEQGTGCGGFLVGGFLVLSPF